MSKREKMRHSPNTLSQDKNIMEIERSNLIGTTLADLGARALALRGYL